MRAFPRLMPVFVLFAIALSSLSTAGDDSVSEDSGSGVGIAVNAPLNVKFGDLIHIEWTTNRSVSYELRYQTEYNSDKLSYFGSIDAGNGMVGNYTFNSTINGTYSMHFINDADGVVLLHIRMTATSSGSGVDEIWVNLGLVLVTAVIAVVLVLFVRRRSGKDKGLLPAPKLPK